MTPKEKISQARTGLILDHIFFGALALRLKMQADPSLAVAGVDGVTLRYNPATIEAMSLPEVKFLVAHEVMHCALAHHVRRAGRDHSRWNQAGDYAINGILINTMIGEFPEGGLHNAAYDGKSADEIYSLLPPPPDGGEEGGWGGGEAGSTPGAAATGTVEDAPAPPDENGNPPPPSAVPSESQLSRLESDWKVATAQAAQAARMAGNLPAGLERLVEEILAPRVDWRAVLRRFLTAAREDYSWTPPNRRFIWQGLYLPSLHSEGLHELVIGVDTSGSIDEELLAEFAAELTGILADFPSATIRVVYCDAQVNAVEAFTADDLPVKLRAVGGGGTAFQPVFDWVADEGITPSCLVYLTDLCGPDPEPPPYPVLWVTYGSDDAPFGEVVRAR